ncbi:MAG: hypothetical protein ACR2PR_06045 [Pseudohongiellaceae bacterium]
MADLKQLQSDFSAGVLDPLVAGRVDTEIYFKGVQVGDNVTPLTTGGVTKRPGTSSIVQYPPQLVPIGGNLIGDGAFNFDIVEWPEITAGDAAVRAANTTTAPNQQQQADGVTFANFIGTGLINGIQRQIADPGPGTYTFAVYMLSSAAGEETFELFVGRAQCFPGLLTFPIADCYDFGFDSVTFPAGDTGYHMLTATVTKPDDGLPLDIWIGRRVTGVGATMRMWGASLYPGLKVPRAVNFSVDTSANGGTDANVFDFDDATNSETTTALGLTTDYVIAEVDLGEQIEINFIDVIGLRLVNGTNPATPLVLNDFRIETSHDGTNWNALGNRLERVDTIARNYRRGSFAFGFPVITGNARDVRYIRVIRIGDIVGTPDLVDWDAQILGIEAYAPESYNSTRRHEVPITDVNAVTIYFPNTNITPTNNTTAGPNGDVDFDTIAETAVNGEHSYEEEETLVAAQTYTLEVTTRVGVAGSSFVRLSVQEVGQALKFVFFNLDTAEVSSSSSDATGEVFFQRGSYRLLRMKFTASVSGDADMKYNMSNADGVVSYLGIVTSTHIVGNFHMESLYLPEFANVRLIPFSFNTEQNYIVVATEHNYLIVRADDEQLLIDPGPITFKYGAITTFARNPYKNDDIPLINWVQSADVLIVFRETIRPQELIRLSDTEWQSRIFAFDGANGIPDNDFGAGNEPVWSDARGWPQCGTFYQLRLVMAGATETPNFIALSQTGAFNIFDSAAANDASSITAFLDSDQINEIKQVRGGRRLEMFTSGAEFVSQDGVMTPSTFSVQVQSAIGIIDAIRPVNIDGATIFLGRDLSRSVTEAVTAWQFLFDFSEESFRPNDLAILSSHLLTGPVDMDAQPAKNSYIYVQNEDGTIAVLLTSRQQEVAAWSRWTSKFPWKSTAVVQNGSHWVATEVTDDNGRRFPYLCLFDDEADTDAEVTINQTPQTDTVVTISDPLQSTDVRVILNDVPVPGILNSANDGNVADITFPSTENVAKIQVGIQFEKIVTTMPISFALPKGVSFGEFVRLVKCLLRFDKTQSIVINGRAITFDAENSSGYDAVLNELTGFFEEYLEGWDRDAQITISQTEPVGFTLLSSIIEYEV